MRLKKRFIVTKYTILIFLKNKNFVIYYHNSEFLIKIPYQIKK